jgi:serine/threonine-protein kinase
MATIYRGADLRLDRPVAIKVMHPSFASDPGFVDRFEREARAAARLNSPYAVGVHDQGNDHGVTYLIMEYVPGHTVRDVLRAHGALSPAQALSILDPVLEALAAAHRAGYIHRDIKPENVLISEDGRVKVTDFGLARAIEGADSGRTHGLLLGTVAYLSPEQVEHDRTDARSDVYSAGILLFELVTGQVPFSAAAPMQVAYKHVHEDVPAPSSIRPGLPAGIDELVVRATRRSPDQRFPDASAFLAEVRALRATMPVAAPWAPAPNDTLVVSTGDIEVATNGAAGQPPAAPEGAAAAAGAPAASASAAADSLDAPDWVNGPAAPGPQDAPAAPAAPEDDSSPAVPHVSAALPAEPHSTEVTHHTAPDGAGRVRRGRKAMWLGVIALLSAAGLVWLVLVGPLNRVDVPDVLGKTPTEAAAILATSNLLLDAEETAYSEDFPKGQIMATDPGPESSIRTGGTVLATVSRGPERYDVPKLKGLTVEEAQVALAAANLALGETTQAYDDKVKKDDVISSSPKAGTSVKRDTKVDVKVSKGPEPVTMPEVVGTDGDTAEKQLADLGLEVDRSNKFSETVPKGQVISVEPPAGATAYRGDTVQLVVSKGPPLVEVPNVVGKNESAARAALEAAGFAVQVNKPLGFVVFGVNSQNPRGGTKAPKGSTVTITVV